MRTINKTKKYRCGKAFTDDDCEDETQFWFCEIKDEEDGEVHYCDQCEKKSNKKSFWDKWK